MSDPTPSLPCLCARVRRASRALTRAYDEALAPAGLTVMQFSALRNVERMGDPTLTVLAQATGHERSAMWRTLQPLAREGLLTLGSGRGRDAGKIEITDAGQALLERALPYWQAAQDRLHVGLGEDRRRALIALLSEVEVVLA
ncbi:MarR family winged helix-turn-helix transcriptional regulator [Caulobacter sp. 17J65-9]|uniref:MarR family winged helix-turn-helix transcriptional regulator n=1 Tax=Caulobacter sp. 17J65-9 TaxID=2709382 RepID=UPI0013C9BB1A|nr:MarR family winged helix-turn-helix transcriptional regulator [Caulobacter sp. 17J65-9]NEX91306.1 winged helix-turn-helix transcriptional regulator [Caulobacter sp. 17J65-9]